MPSRKHLAQEMIPTMYTEVMGRIKEELRNVELHQTYGHPFEMTITSVVPFPKVSHTAQNICQFLSKLVSDWDLSQKVVAVVRDNGRNITAGLEMSSFEHIPCLAHTLQLVLKDRLLGSEIVTNLLSQCRRLVWRFKLSAHATKILKKCQMTTEVPLH
ncbi:hypothetical protein PR048_032585 [Dryococelus australis]|uniref:Transposase n=1 Tax=Dryococelus australis TaxID=614101 RepID=A0ABQ9G2L4_9NEOP|nr:hypothetical protein PR048_032585 [Dryococelus australis]